MKFKDFEEVLRAKQKQLQAEITQHAAEARSLAGAERQDREDTGESKEAVFQETTLEWQTFRQVEEALERLARGTYGHCLDCGMQIENDRLRAVPWAQFCLKHQKDHDPPVPSQAM